MYTAVENIISHCKDLHLQNIHLTLLRHIYTNVLNILMSEKMAKLFVKFDDF